MRRWRLPARTICVGLLIVSGATAENDAFNPFFAFKNSMESGGPASVDEQVRILKEIGFDGFDNRDLNGLPAALAALDRAGLKLCSIYFAVRIDPEEQPFNPGLEAALPLLKDRGTLLWCNTHSKRFRPSDPEGDEFAVPIFRRIADLAAPYGVRVAPYPHIGMWVETPEDTARLADKVNRPNFGTSFNLFHWNALGERKLPLEEIVRVVGPRMFLMSINGDVGPHDIGPLEVDDIETYYGVLKAFRDAGYRGPVGLQCYLIPGDPREHLRQSFAVWTKLKELLAKESPTP